MILRGQSGWRWNRFGRRKKSAPRRGAGSIAGGKREARTPRKGDPQNPRTPQACKKDSRYNRGYRSRCSLKPPATLLAPLRGAKRHTLRLANADRAVDKRGNLILFMRTDQAAGFLAILKQN